MAKSILGRKRDLAYLVYFALHIPIMFIVDLYPLYPPHLLPSFMINLRTWYISTYDDRFFVDPPPFFTLYAWLELFYHVPVSGWCVWGLVSDHPKIPLVLLPYATQTFITTLTCMFDYSTWETDLSHKVGLTSLYGPYLALSLFMLVDMYTRLDSVISKSSSSGKIGQKGLWESDGDREGKKEL